MPRAEHWLSQFLSTVRRLNSEQKGAEYRWGMREIPTVHAEPRENIESPVYRVNFWQKPAAGRGWSLDAYALTDAEDITEVLRWVNENAHGRRVEVFAETDDEPEGSFQTPRKTGLVRLLGSNPNAEGSVTFQIRAVQI